MERSLHDRAQNSSRRLAYDWPPRPGNLDSHCLLGVGLGESGGKSEKRAVGEPETGLEIVNHSPLCGCPRPLKMF